MIVETDRKDRYAVRESKILTGARQALAFARGELTEGVVVRVPPDFDVKALRRKLGMSQAKLTASSVRKRLFGQ